MATTSTTVRSNRRDPAECTIGATVTGVALDATVLEFFRLPTNFGDLLIRTLMCDVTALSGAYVAPAPAFDGALFAVYDPNSFVDCLAAVRWVNYSTASARPQLAATFEFQHPALVRQNELIAVQMPIMAGAGVTGSVDLFVRGVRLRQA